MEVPDSRTRKLAQFALSRRVGRHVDDPFREPGQL
jgi:hypothetical protein